LPTAVIFDGEVFFWIWLALAEEVFPEAGFRGLRAFRVPARRELTVVLVEA
jgi:hypothetical protein